MIPPNKNEEDLTTNFGLYIFANLSKDFGWLLSNFANNSTKNNPLYEINARINEAIKPNRVAVSR
jgi:hypothetical protein